MKVRIEATVTAAKEGYHGTDEDEICKILIEGNSTKEVEEKMGKVQQALTHMGWQIGKY